MNEDHLGIRGALADELTHDEGQRGLIAPADLAPRTQATPIDDIDPLPGADAAHGGGVTPLGTREGRTVPH